MSSLEKLAIRGIRSFDDKELAVMQFYTPLTVIVGHNGSGKTTIIECLKYVTTGDLPPNTKGGAFIHDPQIANEREVKAEVRLRFKNVNKDRMVVIRKLQVSQKKTALSMKTLEGTLSFADDAGDSNKRRTISTRTAELDEELPEQLGVSKAILENVIFCHQEDSNWPLSEPAALKKKFDDIFEATKYTKALDQIKSIKKEMAADIKVDKERLIALKTDRERAKKLETNIDKITVDINERETEAEQLDAQIKVLYENNNRFYDQATRYTEIINKAATLQTSLQTLEGTIDSTAQTLQILTESDDEIRAKLQNFEKHVADHAKVLQQQRLELNTQEETLDKLRARQGRELALEGKLQGEAETHKSNLEDRQRLVVQLAGQHGIAGFDVLPLENGQIANFQSRLDKEVARKNDSLKELKSKRAQEESDKIAEIQALKSKEAGALEKKRGITGRITALKSEVRSLTSRIEGSDVNETEITSRENMLGDVQNQLKSVKESLTQTNFDLQIRETASKCKEAENERDSYLKDIASFNRNTESRAKLALKKEEKSARESSLQTSLSRSADKYGKYIGGQPTAANMEHEVNSAFKQKEAEVNGAEQAASAVNREYQVIETKTTFSKNRLAKLRQELSGHEKLVSEALSEFEADNLKDAMSACEAEISWRRDNLETASFSAKFYAGVLKIAKERHQCTACQRPLADADLPAMETFCKKMISAQKAGDQSTLQQELTEWEEEMSKLRAAIPSEASIKKLRDSEIPTLEKEQSESSAKYSKISADQEEARRRIEELKADLREITQLKRSAADVSRFNSEIKSLQSDIDHQEATLEHTGSTETIEEVQKKLETVSEEIAKLVEKSKKLSLERDSQKNRMQSLETQISNHKLELTNLKHALQERSNWESRKEELRKHISDLDMELKNNEKDTADVSEPIRKLQDSLAELRTDFDRKERELRLQLESYEKSNRQLEQANMQIEKYEKSRSQSELARCRQALLDLKKEMHDVEKKIQQMRVDARKMEQQVIETDQIKRNLIENQKYREQKMKASALRDEYDALDVESAERAKAKYHTQYEKERKRQVELQGKHSELIGMIGSLKKNYQEKKQELASEYKDIKNEYRNQLIKVKINEFAIQDLEKYGKALDSAIMKYHEHKMKEINDTISHLWTKTYQGTDIDKIMIKSDAEGVKAGGRSYNYRVVMLKDQVEMDMRGRCSAGQKVLASIIIRLALAESFGTNCGILALDEPTTNLDKDNIQSLAASLADIIRDRRSQSNFQLIVITHDEDLLAELSRADVLDRFWRVSRNHRQKSQIERQWIDSFA